MKSCYYCILDEIIELPLYNSLPGQVIYTYLVLKFTGGDAYNILNLKTFIKTGALIHMSRDDWVLLNRLLLKVIILCLFQQASEKF